VGMWGEVCRSEWCVLDVVCSKITIKGLKTKNVSFHLFFLFLSSKFFYCSFVGVFSKICCDSSLACFSCFLAFFLLFCWKRKPMAAIIAAMTIITANAPTMMYMKFEEFEHSLVSIDTKTSSWVSLYRGLMMTCSHSGWISCTWILDNSPFQKKKKKRLAIVSLVCLSYFDTLVEKYF